MINFLLPLLSGWKARILGALAGGAITATLASIVTGAVRVVVGLCEIVIDLARSPEGRILLLLIALTIGGLYGRYHYLSQGRAEICSQVARNDGVAVRRVCGLPVRVAR